MPRRTKKFGGPIYGPKYTDPNGVAKTWSPFYGRYVADDGGAVAGDQEATKDAAGGVPRGETAPLAPPRANGEDLDDCQGRPDDPRGADAAKAREHLGQALDHILAALGSLRDGAAAELPDLPDEAFDLALKADADHQANRKAFVRAFQRVFVAMPVSARTRLMRLEESVNALVVGGATVAWRMGLKTGGRGRT